MNNNHIALLSSAAFVAVLTASGLTARKYYHNIYERFPQHDRKVLRKAYRKLLWDSFSGKYHSTPMHTDELMDELFLKTVAEVTARK